MSGTLLPNPPQDGDLIVQLHASEPNLYNAPTRMAFSLMRERGALAFTKAHRPPPSPTAAEDHIAEQRDWSGGFGAYRHNPQQPNRYGVSQGADCSVPGQMHAGPRRYEAAFDTGISWSAVARAGVEISNTNASNSRILVASGTTIYRITDWPAPVIRPTTNGNFSVANCINLTQFDNYVFAGCDDGEKWLYSTNYGDSWAGNTHPAAPNPGYEDGIASHFCVLNHALHKIRQHSYSGGSWVKNVVRYNVTLAAGSAPTWGSEGSVGDVCNVQELLGRRNKLWVIKEDGPYVIDGGYNPQDPYPELKRMRDVDNGQRAAVFFHRLLYPTTGGGLVMLGEDDGFYWIDPQRQQSGQLLDGLAEAIASVAGGIKAIGIATDAVYVSAQRQVAGNNNHRLYKAVWSEGAIPIWHNFAEQESSSQGVMFVSSVVTGGPVLWVSQGTEFNYRMAYYILPRGMNPLRDSRCRFESSWNVYCPFLEHDYPAYNKRGLFWEGEASVPAGTSLTVKAVDEDGTEAFSVALSDGFNTVDYPAGWIKKKWRLRFYGTNSDPTKTAVLWWYRDHAAVLFPERQEITATLNLEETAAKTSAEQLKLFLLQLQSCQYPVTVIDPDGIQWTMMPERGSILQARGKLDSGMSHPAGQVRFLEEI